MDTLAHDHVSGENELTVGANDGGTPRDAHHTMNEDPATAAEGRLDEETCAREVDENILVLGILHSNDHGVGLRVKRVFCADR